MSMVKFILKILVLPIFIFVAIAQMIGAFFPGIGGVVMNRMEEEGYSVYRDELNIIVETNENKKFVFPLKKQNIVTGKINIPLSNLCTMNCLYCSEAEYNRKKAKRFDINVAYQIIDAYMKWLDDYPSVNQVRLSFDYGGEPVCQIDLLEKIVAYFRKKCAEKNLFPITIMTTNCAWNNKVLPRVVSCIDEIIVSLDGPQDMHDRYRKYKNENMTFDVLLNNAIEIKKSGHLKRISSVITKETIKKPKEYIDFFRNYFQGNEIKIAAVIILGDAITNDIERVSFSEWNKFVDEIKTRSKNELTIIDSKPEKKLDYIYTYGCEHMNLINWFCWLDGNISCCTDRENSNYHIGTIVGGMLEINPKKMLEMKEQNDVNNLTKCHDCLAKYYCSGGCPEFRNEKLNCERRVKKYARMFIQKASEK